MAPPFIRISSFGEREREPAPRRQARLPAPVTAIVASAIVARPNPARPRIRPDRPIAGPPGVARTARVPISGHPCVIWPRRGWNIRYHSRWRRRKADSNSDEDPRPRKERTSGKQNESEQFGFHFLLLPTTSAALRAALAISRYILFAKHKSLRMRGKLRWDWCFSTTAMAVSGRVEVSASPNIRREPEPPDLCDR